MKLALDVGNSEIVIGCVSGEVVKSVFRISTDKTKTADEYTIIIENILNFHNIDCKKIDGAIISSVVPPLTGAITSAVKNLTGVDSLIVGAGLKTGLNILIDDPPTLGADIVASAVGALAKYKPPIIIVDMGTATKLFMLNENGALVGGAILPGLALSMNALSAGASQLPYIPIEAPAKSIGTNTVDSMKSGAIFGAIAAIDGLVERFEAEIGQTAHIVATGGLVHTVYRHSRHKINYEPNLILQGMNVIYEKNIIPKSLK